MNSLRTISSIFLLSLAALSGQAQTASIAAAPPDIIFRNGDILTGAHLQPSDPTSVPGRVTAIAVSHGIVTAVGTDTEVLALKSSATKIIDLNHAFAMPGFNDAHTHIAGAGHQKLTVDLDHVASLQEMQARIKAFATTLAPGAWITGGGWDHTLWSSKTLPTRQDLDAVTAGHPTVLSRTDGHIVIANTAALAAANITAATPDPAGGKIDHDAAGALTGIVRETPAVALLNAVVPKPTREDRRKALTYAMQDALAHGVTSVQDLSDWQDFLALEDLERSGQLHLRVSEWLAFDTPVDVLKQRIASHAAGDPLLHTGMLKGYMDGSLGSRTAALAAPYADDPGNSGIPRYEQTKLDAMTKERIDAGFQIGFHAIGDRANRMALDALSLYSPCGYHPNSACSASAGVAAQPRGSRPRIEHAQVLLPTDFARFELEGVIASMQPSHLLTDMNWASARLGPDRSRYAYAWRSFLDHHVILAFGTDYPVESIDPFRGLYSAITRTNEAGTLTYQPQEKITLNEAIYAYTQASAFAENEEKTKGRLAPGFLADLIVLDRDITKATPQELLHARVLETIVNGEVVYTRQSNTVADNTIHPTYIDDDADE